MNRRIFLKSMALAPRWQRFHRSRSPSMGGTRGLRGTVSCRHANGWRWDVTQLCDPKTNTPGEPDINNWANTSEIQTAGRIQYAPVASNQRLLKITTKNAGNKWCRCADKLPYDRRTAQLVRPQRGRFTNIDRSLRSRQSTRFTSGLCE